MSQFPCYPPHCPKCHLHTHFFSTLVAQPGFHICLSQSPFLSSLSTPSGSWFCGLPSPNSCSALFPTLSPCNSRFFLQINPIFPSFLPSASYQPETSQEDLFSLCLLIQPNIFLVFFSLTSNPPLLNHPPSSPFISQLLFCTPLSYWWRLVLIFTLLFFLSLLFPFLSSTFRSSSFFPKATWIPGTSANSVEEMFPALACTTGWAFPMGFVMEMMMTPHSKISWSAIYLVTLCSWHVDAPLSYVPGKRDPGNFKPALNTWEWVSFFSPKYLEIC